MTHEEKLIFEISQEGREGAEFDDAEFDAKEEAGVPSELVRKEIEHFPELSEVDVVRHYTRLSKWNYGVDDGLYPLGSCTMKYNPKINEDLARLGGFTELHPYQDDKDAQGALALMFNLEKALCEITGMDFATLQPAAGAHGELTGLLVIRAHFNAKGEKRKKVLIPDSAHGTNPASVTLAGYEAVEVKASESGQLSVDGVREKLDADVAALMVTNPNTLGIFEGEIKEIADLLHKNGSLLYCDGANLNALLGYHRPGDAGVDIVHINLHKTFSTPHGGGGPGSGPIAVKSELGQFLPIPRITKKENGELALDYDKKNSIGRVRAFFGNFAILVRAYAYIRSMGGAGLKEVAENSVLNANYIRSGLIDKYHLQYETPTLHEVVFSDKFQREKDITALDIAKRLLDYGLHPPTIFFPLCVKGALMIEPTDTESAEEIDRFISAMRAIAEEAQSEPKILKDAPRKTHRRRLDEVRAAKELKLRWRPA